MNISDKVYSAIKAVDNFGLARAEDVRSFSQRDLGLDKYDLTYLTGFTAALTGFTLNYANNYDNLPVETIVPLTLGVAFGYGSKGLEKLSKSYEAHFYHSAMNFFRPLYLMVTSYGITRASMEGFSGEELTHEIVSAIILPIVYFASLPKEPPKQLENLATQET